MRVRPATASDAGAIVDLYRQLAGDRSSALPCDIDEAETMLASIASQAGRLLVVAEMDGKVVGTADMVVIDNLTHGGRPWAMVENVVVDQSWRGNQVGIGLMTALLDEARVRRCYKMQLLSMKHRTAAHAFYRNLGFDDSLAEGFRLYLD